MKILVVLFLMFGTLFSAELTDMVGRKVVLQSTPKTFVALGPGALRLAVYLGLNNAAVGIETVEKEAIDIIPYRASLGKAKIDTLPVIGEGGVGKLPDIKALQKTKPDVIIAASFDAEALDELQKKTSIPVVAVDYDSLYIKNGSKFSSIKLALKLLGDVFDKRISANATIIFMDRQSRWLISDVQHKPDVYIGGLDLGGRYDFLNTDGHYLPFELLGLTSGAVTGAGMFHVSQKDLLRANPEYIFTNILAKKELQKSMAKDGAFFNKLHAFKNKKTMNVLPYRFYGVNIENCFVDAYLIKSFILKQPINQKKIKSNYNSFFPINSDKAYQAAYNLLFADR